MRISFFVCQLLLISETLLAFSELKNLTLKMAEEIALEYNQEFLISSENRSMAKERKLQAISKWFPSIQYLAEFRDVNQKELFFDIFSKKEPFSHRGYWSALELNQPLLSTDLIFGLKSKNIEYNAFSYSVASSKNDLLLAVRNSYYLVAFFEEALQIERENIEYLSYALQQEQGKLEAGSATPYEVNQSKVAVTNAISLYYLTLKELKNARNVLILNLGIDPLLEPILSLKTGQIPIESIPEVVLKMDQLKKQNTYSIYSFPTYDAFVHHIEGLEQAKKLTLFTDYEVCEYVEMALQKRPDLQRSRLSVDVAEENIRLKQGEYAPKIQGYARYSYNDVYLGTDPYLSQDYHWSVGVQLSWNLFDSLLRERKIKEAKYQKRAANLAYRQTMQRVEVEVRNGLYQLEETILAYLSASQGVLLAMQAREQAADKLEFGRIAPLEYRDSVNLLFQAKNQKNRSALELIKAFYELRFATGVDVYLNTFGISMND